MKHLADLFRRGLALLLAALGVHLYAGAPRPNILPLFKVQGELRREAMSEWDPAYAAEAGADRGKGRRGKKKQGAEK